MGDQFLDENLGVKIAFAKNEGVLLEFVEPLSGSDKLLRTLDRRPGSYHYAFEIRCSSQGLEEWAVKNKMVFALKESPAVAFPEARVSFLVARDSSVIELIRYSQ